MSLEQSWASKLRLWLVPSFYMYSINFFPLIYFIFIPFYCHWIPLKWPLWWFQIMRSPLASRGFAPSTPTRALPLDLTGLFKSTNCSYFPSLKSYLILKNWQVIENHGVLKTKVFLLKGLALILTCIYFSFAQNFNCKFLKLDYLLIYKKY